MNTKANEKSALTNVIETEIDILKRHVNILKVLQKDQPMGIIKLSEITEYPQHMVRYSLRILEQDGIIEPSSKGAITTDKVPQTLIELKDSLKDISDDARSTITNLSEYAAETAVLLNKDIFTGKEFGEETANSLSNLMNRLKDLILSIKVILKERPALKPLSPLGEVILRGYPT